MSHYLLLLNTIPSLRLFIQEDELWLLSQLQAEKRPYLLVPEISINLQDIYIMVGITKPQMKHRQLKKTTFVNQKKQGK